MMSSVNKPQHGGKTPTPDKGVSAEDSAVLRTHDINVGAVNSSLKQ
ncbi:Gluconate transporter protein [Pseudomonas savastanoi]|uniref:Gluconate transporter protein n=1 Tax=Pseudomonas savastanoi TaxID=29438 RepID=A0A3M5ZGC6_PSESS|nr:Gluconate transporter protein [Pseudomonas savastanoi]